MNHILDDKDLAVLECLTNSPVALGSWNLVELLEKRGIEVSSATIGRVLRRLENKHYVYKISNTGRSISKQGREALMEAKALNMMNKHQEALNRVISVFTLENYVIVLQARRAVERESARLAAINITDSELAHLDEVLRQQDEYYQAGKSVAQIDIEFHRSIAHASRNQVLESMYHMLFSAGQQTPLFEEIRKKKKSIMTSHRGILEALHEHDSQKAERRMIAHIDGLIQDVTTYWDYVEEHSDDTPSICK